MIPIINVWRSVQSTAKKTTTGYQTKAEFNDDVELVQLTIVKAVAEQYEKEQVVSDDLSHLVVTLASLPVDKPAGYFRFIAAEINGDEVYPIHRNALAMTKKSSIRGEVKGFYFEDNKIKFHLGKDTSVSSSTFTYIKRPPVAELDLEYSETAGSDYQTPVSIADLDWPDSVRNLIEYMLLERLGIQTRDLIAIEFGRLGIQRETSNYQ